MSTAAKAKAAFNAAFSSLGFVLIPYALFNVFGYPARHAAPPIRCRVPWTLVRREWDISCFYYNIDNYLGFAVTAAMIATNGKLSVRSYQTAYCSALAAECLVRAGHIFEKPPASMSPGDLARHLGVQP